MRLTVHGARGSIPSAPDDPSEFGARTCCVSLDAGSDLLIFDAGTGIVDFGRSLIGSDYRTIDLFLSHAHYDHVIGLPYFAPLFHPGFTVRIHAGHMLDGQSCKQLVCDFLRPPFHPVGIEKFKAKVEFVTFAPGDSFDYQGFHLSTHRLNHPNGAVAYRVERAGRTIVYATDHEHIPGRDDPALEAFVERADVLIYDTTYTDDEMSCFAGYGHSSHQEGVRLCDAAGVEALVLFHHHYKHDDATLSAIEAQAQALKPGTVSARVGLVIELDAANGAATGA